jgi:hypothetical protein
LENFVTILCQTAIGINALLLVASMPLGRADLGCLAVINIALLSTHFLFKEEE